MAGLLGDSWDDPKTMAALQLAAGLLSGGNFGQAAGRGLAGYAGTMQAAQEQQRLQREQAMRQQLQQAQMEEYRAQAAQHQAAAQVQAQALARQQAFQGELNPQSVSGGAAASLPGGPSPQNAGVVGSAAPLDFQALARRYPDFIAKIKELADAKNFGRDEVARTVEVAGANGMPETQQRSKFGDIIGASLPKPVEMKLENLGGSSRAYNPFALKPGDVFQRTQSPDSVASNATSRANNRDTIAAENERSGVSMTKPFEVTGPDGLPMLVRQDRAGNITPVQGFGPKSGSSKPLNDTQAKALLFGTRMQESNKVIEAMQGQYSPAAVNAKMGAENTPLLGGALGMIGNAMMGAPGQQIEQAQRDFVNAVLRRESGAVISQPEFDNARKQYFPQPNDKPDTLAQKKRNRELAIAGLLAEVPEGRRASITPAGSVSGGWTVTEVK